MTYWVNVYEDRYGQWLGVPLTERRRADIQYSGASRRVYVLRITLKEQPKS